MPGPASQTAGAATREKGQLCCSPWKPLNIVLENVVTVPITKLSSGRSHDAPEDVDVTPLKPPAHGWDLMCPMTSKASPHGLLHLFLKTTLGVLGGSASHSGKLGLGEVHGRGQGRLPMRSQRPGDHSGPWWWTVRHQQQAKDRSHAAQGVTFPTAPLPQGHSSPRAGSDTSPLTLAGVLAPPPPAAHA